MNKIAAKTSENKSQDSANSKTKHQSNCEPTFHLIDNRPEVILQRKLQKEINNSPHVQQLKDYQEIANGSPHLKQFKAYQTMADNFTEQTPPQKKDLTQLGKVKPVQKKKNTTGIPDNLKSGIETLSGYSMDDVKVHYNSDKPAQLNAHAYAQGTDIHLASGQEKHLPHEAWHVVQQKQGRVNPTLQMKGKVNVNDDLRLEKEADVMGAKAARDWTEGRQKEIQVGINSSSIESKGTALPQFDNKRENGIPQLIVPGIGHQPNQTVQRVIEEDLGKLGKIGVYHMLLRSNRGSNLVEKANKDGVEIIAGHGRASTTRMNGGMRIVVKIQIAGRTDMAILQDVAFELNNAIRQARFDSVRDGAITGAIPDKDEYARELIRLELEGMINTALIGMELYKQGIKNIKVHQMFIGEYLGYLDAKKEKQNLSIQDYINSRLDVILDTPHELGSHRTVYRKQFEEYKNPQNERARKNAELDRLANQIVNVSKFTNYIIAVDKFRKETDKGVEVQAYVAHNQDKFRDLHLAFTDPMFKHAELLEHSNDKEADLNRIGKQNAAVLFSWVEKNDTGRFRNLSQILGLFLGYYTNKPELLRTNIYK